MSVKERQPNLRRGQNRGREGSQMNNLAFRLRASVRHSYRKLLCFPLGGEMFFLWKHIPPGENSSIYP